MEISFNIKNEADSFKQICFDLYEPCVELESALKSGNEDEIKKQVKILGETIASIDSSWAGLKDKLPKEVFDENTPSP